MFCDLVGSTALSGRMDPEDLAELLGRYRALVETEVRKLDGVPDRFLGDGVMVTFGHPVAHEDDAVRAVRAALAIIRGIDALSEHAGVGLDQRLQAHIGIHTGMVLVDRTPDGAGGIIGETPNLAAKVESVAPPDAVLVSSATHALTARLFDFAPFAPLELKGFASPLELYRLVGERDWRREERGRRPGGQILFGRAEETAKLARLWRQATRSPPARDGGGRAALIIGEPGIGKTRLTQWAADNAEAAGGTVAKFYCAEEAVDTAFWPVSETVSRLCRLTGETVATQLSRLAATAARVGLPPERFVPAMADLLSIAAPAQTEEERGLTPEARRQRVVAVLFEWVAKAAAQAPMLLIVENAHWADPSSMALFDELARRAKDMRLLLLVTARPKSDPALAAFPAERIMLERLPSPDLEAMLASLWREAILPGDMQRILLDKCDGVPLFLEQLVKTVAERASRGGSSVLPDVPTSLRDMLAARLDQLGPAKLIALAASVIGRVFPAKLLRALLPRRKQDIDAGLAALIQADIISPVGAPTEASFKFRHALLRDAAYDSLLRGERARHHRTLSRAYRRHYATLVEAQPELVARHASAAGDLEEALEFWWKAGLRARARSANREATAHFRTGIADAERLGEPADGKRQVVRFLMATSRAAFAAEGFASPEVERLNSRALALLEEGGSTDLLPAVLGAISSFYQVRGPLRHALESGHRILRLLAAEDREGRASTKRRLGWCLFCQGDVREGVSFLSDAVRLAQGDSQNEEGGLAVFDTMVLGSANLGWAESFAGDLVSGSERCRNSVTLARRRYADRNQHARDTGHLPSEMAYTLCLSAAVAKQAEDPASVVAFAGEARDFAIAHDLPYWRAWATVLLGWGVAHDEAGRGLALLRDGIAAYKATGARLFVPYNLALLAEACMALGQAAEGLAHVAEALAVGEEIDVHFMDPELLRIEARLRAQSGDVALALATFDKAIALAARQGAMSIQKWAERDRNRLTTGAREKPAPAAKRVKPRPKPRRKDESSPQPDPS
jgi:class 3 adenylate cyclase/tetratricopeptide (TPR) repeat protein